MKKIITLLSAVLLSVNIYAQTYNSPESVEFDYANNRWLIANNSGNNILARSSSTGALTVFASSVTGPHGLEIVNDTLYVCSGASLKAFNINTGASVFSINLGASFLNGITHDNSGYLYITDYSTKKIYRFNINDHSFSIFVAATGGTFSPNGIIYDQPNNRCVFVSFGTSTPIKAMDITTGAVTTIITSTLGNCDGIAKDGAGNWYISSWSGSKITRYTNTFTTPTIVVTGLSSPADIFYNTVTDTLGVPNSGSANNTAYYYFGTATGIDQDASQDGFDLSIRPNPVKNIAEISYFTSVDGDVKIQLYDINGKLVQVLLNQNQQKGVHTLMLDKNSITPGTYILKLDTEMQAETLRVVFTE